MCERKRIKEDSKAFGLSNWKDGAAINWNKGAYKQNQLGGKRGSSLLDIIDLCHLWTFHGDAALAVEYLSLELRNEV